MVKTDKYWRKFNRTYRLDMEYLYKKYRNKIVTEIRKSKNDYYAEYFTKYKINMKMLWSGIHSVFLCLSHNGLIVDNQKMANIFNNAFVNTSQKINEKVSQTRKSP